MNQDLDAALSGPGDRAISSYPIDAMEEPKGLNLATAFAGNDTMLTMPVAHCWSGDRILVLDGGAQRIGVFDEEGRLLSAIGSSGAGPGEFGRPGALACSRDGSRVLVADPGNNRVTQFSDAGEVLVDAETPPIPQAIPYVGEFAVGRQGRWFDSWLGSRVGPYLSASEWQNQGLFRIWSPRGSLEKEGGGIRAYSDPAARRVFNKTDLELVDDTLWVLTQADARLRGYVGASRVAEMWLPVYHRGSDPLRIVDGGDGPGYRRNRIIYEPNVGDFAWLDERKALLVLRYSDWTSFERGEGRAAYTQLWPESSVEVRDISGELVAAFRVPGYAKELATNGRDRVTVLSENRKTAADEIWLFELRHAVRN